MVEVSVCTLTPSITTAYSRPRLARMVARAFSIVALFAGREKSV
jgi:hypothetical protein